MACPSRRSGPSTFSIVAYDFENKDLGVAVQSKFPAVGAVVPWAKAKVGAVATQASVNVTFGSQGMRLLQEGLSAQEVLRKLLAQDLRQEVRQVAIVDSKGEVAAHTGKECMEWAGHVSGKGYSCQGNILASSRVVEAMARAYEESEGDLIDKLIAALSGGQAAGGDRRGQQSAAILIVREKGGYEGFTDRYVDLRVDDHAHPIEELKRVLGVYNVTMLSREDPKNLLTIDQSITTIIQRNLTKLGIYRGQITGKFDASTEKALENWVDINNFENRMREPGRIWKSILDYMEEMSNRG
ncbi:MAG: DUF1028 domain-containing protein [Candidatus Bathyarchaeia archaeon]